MNFVIILAILAFGEPLPLAARWFDHYEAGILYVKAGDGPAAIAELSAALALEPREGLRVPTQPGHYVDYIPRIYLAAAHHLTGNPDGARDELARAESSGVAAQTETGRELLAAYRTILLAMPDARPRAREPVAPRGSRPLPADELGKVMRLVARKCGVVSTADPSLVPWYFDYELGLELERRGDLGRALDALTAAAGKKQEPRIQARMYGMWFIDYTPYFRIARLQVDLGNLACARDAIRLSEQVREVPLDSALRGEWESVRAEIAARSAGD